MWVFRVGVVKPPNDTIRELCIQCFSTPCTLFRTERYRLYCEVFIMMTPLSSNSGTSPVKSDLYLWESAADRGGDPSVLVGAAREQSLFFISCSWPFRPSSMVVAIDRPRQLSYHLKGWPTPYRWVSHLIV